MNSGKSSEVNGVNKVSSNSGRIPQEVIDYIDIISGNYSPYTGEIPVFPDSDMTRLVMPVMYIAGEDDKLTNAPKCDGRLKNFSRSRLYMS
ncbi:MAG: hypothetical protein PHY18_04975 [Dehalococcoidales bacterium]|nr:hypothetical protein [Dehalococcoidales bacterium]